MPQFEWDGRKSEENLNKHGVSLEQAVEIWAGVRLEVAQLAYAKNGEVRSATIGWIGSKVYLAVWTQRSRYIRLISVRRARAYEEKIFHQAVRNA